MHDLSPLESGAPRQITPHDLSDYLEVLTRAVFNAGLSWQVVHAHWPAIARGFADFEPEIVAGFDEHDVERLMADERMIRSRRKIAATPENARALLDIAEAADGFAGWLHGFDDYDARERALRREFAFIGEFGAYWCMYTWQDDVPDYREWAEARNRSVPAFVQ